MLSFVQNLSSRSVLGPSIREFSNKECQSTTASTIRSSHKDGGYKVYKYMTFFVGIPVILAVAALTYINKLTRGCEERQPFVPYEFLRRRTKRFPWGEGTRSLFHNPAVNALPDGYEVEHLCPRGGGKEQSECDDISKTEPKTDEN